MFSTSILSKLPKEFVLQQVDQHLKPAVLSTIDKKQIESIPNLSTYDVLTYFQNTASSETKPRTKMALQSKYLLLYSRKLSK